MLFVGLFSLTALATNEPTNQDIQKEIASLLDDIKLPEGDDYQAVVDFMINDDNQIVVVSVDTEDAFVDSLIKSRLNYKTIDATAPANKLNSIKITLKQPE